MMRLGAEFTRVNGISRNDEIGLFIARFIAKKKNGLYCLRRFPIKGVQKMHLLNEFL